MEAVKRTRLCGKGMISPGSAFTTPPPRTGVNRTGAVQKPGTPAASPPRKLRLSAPLDTFIARVELLGVAKPYFETGMTPPSSLPPLNEQYTASTFYMEKIRIDWPFRAALAPQKQILLRILRACRDKQSVLLESPTGTGKTFALLSAALAWARSCDGKTYPRPQIVYGVRTHAQANQVLKQLKKSPYAHHRAVVLGGRGKLCTNLEVRKHANNIDTVCRAIRGACGNFVRLGSTEVPVFEYGGSELAELASEYHGCCSGRSPAGPPPRGRSPAQKPFMIKSPAGRVVLRSPAAKAKSPAVVVNEKTKRSSLQSRRIPLARHDKTPTILDIEDLATSLSGACGYYAAHALAGAADIIVCPHNYIIDPAISGCATGHRKNWGLQNRIVILDEAHNVEDMCRDVGSFELDQEEAKQLLKALDVLIKNPNYRDLEVFVDERDGRNVSSSIRYEDSGTGNRSGASGGAAAMGSSCASGVPRIMKAGVLGRRLKDWLKTLIKSLVPFGSYGLGYPWTVENLVEKVFSESLWVATTGPGTEEWGIGPMAPSAAGSSRGPARHEEGRHDADVFAAMRKAGSSKASQHSTQSSSGQQHSCRSHLTLRQSLPTCIRLCQDLRDTIAKSETLCLTDEAAYFSSLGRLGRLQTLLERFSRVLKHPDCYLVHIEGARKKNEKTGTSAKKPPQGLLASAGSLAATRKNGARAAPPPAMISTTSSRSVSSSDDREKAEEKKQYFYALKVHCMRAAAVFEELSSRVDTVILASGTLHPFPVLIHELGHTFQKRLQKLKPLAANHVLPEHRLFVSLVRAAEDVGECNAEALNDDKKLVKIGRDVLG